MLNIRLDKKMRLRLIIVGLAVFALGLFVFLSLRTREAGRIQLTLPSAEGGFMATLYFTSGDADFLAGEPRKLEGYPNTLEGAKLALNGLIRGPENEDLAPTIPESTRLRELYIASGVAYPDFSHELIRNHWGGTCGEVHTVYSIVNTLSLNFEGIRRVQILVDGKEIPTLAGHLDTSRPLSPDISLITEDRSQNVN